MKRFDPCQAREVLDGDTGYQFFLTFDFARSKRVGGLASSAQAYLNLAVKCMLVGYDEPAQRLLQRAFDWLTVAINEQEKPQAYAPDGTEALRYWDLAVCNWLLHGVHDEQSFKQFVAHEERFLSGTKIGRDKSNTSLTLLGYVDAGAYEQALARFAEGRLTPPKSLNSIRNEGQMSYVICRHHLGREYSESDVKSAREKFLGGSVNTWLLDGHFARAAEWMKVAHWDGGKSGVTPKQCILKCYEYLPAAGPIGESSSGSASGN